jgi:hypothetical protein
LLIDKSYFAICLSQSIGGPHANLAEAFFSSTLSLSLLFELRVTRGESQRNEKRLTNIIKNKRDRNGKTKKEN